MSPFYLGGSMEKEISGIFTTSWPHQLFFLCIITYSSIPPEGNLKDWALILKYWVINKSLRLRNQHLVSLHVSPTAVSPHQLPAISVSRETFMSIIKHKETILWEPNCLLKDLKWTWVSKGNRRNWRYVSLNSNYTVENHILAIILQIQFTCH